MDTAPKSATKAVPDLAAILLRLNQLVSPQFYRLHIPRFAAVPSHSKRWFVATYREGLSIQTGPHRGNQWHDVCGVTGSATRDGGYGRTAEDAFQRLWRHCKELPPELCLRVFWRNQEVEQVTYARWEPQGRGSWKKTLDIAELNLAKPVRRRASASVIDRAPFLLAN